MVLLNPLPCDRLRCNTITWRTTCFTVTLCWIVWQYQRWINADIRRGGLTYTGN